MSRSPVRTLGSLVERKGLLFVTLAVASVLTTPRHRHRSLHRQRHRHLWIKMIKIKWWIKMNKIKWWIKMNKLKCGLK